MWAWLSQSIPALCPKQWADKIVLSFSKITQMFTKRIIHTLGMPNISSHDILAGDYFAYNWGYKSRNHLIKRLQTLECPLELLVGVEIGLKNERNSVKTTELLGRYACGVNIDDRDLLRMYSTH